jgi:hypothetical protein
MSSLVKVLTFFYSLVHSNRENFISERCTYRYTKEVKGWVELQVKEMKGRGSGTD